MFRLSVLRQRVCVHKWGLGSAEPLQRKLLHTQALVFDSHVHVRMRLRSRSVFDSTDGASQESAEDLVRACKFSGELFMSRS